MRRLFLLLFLHGLAALLLPAASEAARKTARKPARSPSGGIQAPARCSDWVHVSRACHEFEGEPAAFCKVCKEGGSCSAFGAASPLLSYCEVYRKGGDCSRFGAIGNNLRWCQLIKGQRSCFEAFGPNHPCRPPWSHLRWR